MLDDLFADRSGFGYFKRKAEAYSNSDVYKSVQAYISMMEWCSCDQILELIDGGNHFGEPLVALKHLFQLTPESRKAIQILGIDNSASSKTSTIEEYYMET